MECDYEFYKKIAHRTPDKEMSGADFEALMIVTTHDKCCGARMREEEALLRLMPITGEHNENSD